MCGKSIARRVGAGVSFSIGIIASATIAVGIVQGPTTSRVSISSSGEEANGGSGEVSVSRDGRLVAFRSSATNLVPGDSNGQDDIFVHDRLTGETRRVSVSSTGGQANQGSARPAISADGSVVAFYSPASNLVTGDTNGRFDVFCHDLATGQTERISVSSSGGQANGDSGLDRLAISADGRFVAFASGATNLVSGDSNRKWDVFVHDRSTRQTTRVSVSSSGAQADNGSGHPAISADGRYVSFYSQAKKLVANDRNNVADVFLHDQVTRTTRLVSLSNTGAQGNGQSDSPWLSDDGNFVAYRSWASNLIPGDSNAQPDVFVKNLASGVVTLVSVSSNGAPSDGQSYQPKLSGDGRFVAFGSGASNLVPDDLNATSDVFVRDLLLGTTTRASVDSNGIEGNNASGRWGPAISGDGLTIVFESDANNLLPNDTNGVSDIFVRG